jgi:hypothetical protein
MSIIDQVESPSRARPTRATAVLDIATQASGWGKPLPEGWGRVSRCFGQIKTSAVCPFSEAKRTSTGDAGQLRFYEYTP